MTVSPSMSFEEAYEKLDKILEKMNSDTLTLEETVRAYEEASELLKTCQIRLTAAEQRMEILLKNSSSEKGPLATQPFQPSLSS